VKLVLCILKKYEKEKEEDEGVTRRNGKWKKK